VDRNREQTLLQTVIDSVDDLIFAKDRQGRFILSNRALREGCGLETGLRTEDLFEPDLVVGYQGTDRQVFMTRKPVTADEIIPIHGKPRHFQTVKVPWIVNGDICGVIGVSRDITARKEAEDAVRESEALYRSILDASADCIVVISLDGGVELINEPGCRALQMRSGDTVLGRPWSLLAKANSIEDGYRARHGAFGRLRALQRYAPGKRWGREMVGRLGHADQGFGGQCLAVAVDLPRCHRQQGSVKPTEVDERTRCAHRPRQPQRVSNTS
jgi:PAS domain S-box-containing protein